MATLGHVRTPAKASADYLERWVLFEQRNDRRTVGRKNFYNEDSYGFRVAPGDSLIDIDNVLRGSSSSSTVIWFSRVSSLAEPIKARHFVQFLVR